MDTRKDAAAPRLLKLARRRQLGPRQPGSRCATGGGMGGGFPSCHFPSCSTCVRFCCRKLFSKVCGKAADLATIISKLWIVSRLANSLQLVLQTLNKYRFRFAFFANVAQVRARYGTLHFGKHAQSLQQSATWSAKLLRFCLPNGKQCFKTHHCHMFVFFENTTQQINKT